MTSAFARVTVSGPEFTALFMYSTLKLSCAGETAAKAALSQNDADRGLNNPQLNRNLILRLALVAQRLDLLGQLRATILPPMVTRQNRSCSADSRWGKLASCLHRPIYCLFRPFFRSAPAAHSLPKVQLSPSAQTLWDSRSVARPPNQPKAARGRASAITSLSPTSPRHSTTSSCPCSR